ncbi:hypothetical protein JCM19274_1854 [Algibacter lectus]|uniref:Uncharacterized protein n=1 Tax=Algibacter lectus TaxID=221126 RepID=A0A090WQQ1_9FLAO|nr:hypothetical protein JCM19274_1854 [Algibacter lectus]
MKPWQPFKNRDNYQGIKEGATFYLVIFKIIRQITKSVSLTFLDKIYNRIQRFS